MALLSRDHSMPLGILNSSERNVRARRLRKRDGLGSEKAARTSSQREGHGQVFLNKRKRLKRDHVPFGRGCGGVMMERGGRHCPLWTQRILVIRRPRRGEEAHRVELPR